MAIVLADAGSTKTEWILITESQEPKHFFTPGINPNYMSEQDIRLLFNTLRNQLKEEEFKGITEVHYYGTGCARPAGAEKIKQIATNTFPMADIDVASDLLAAAIALLQDQPGLAAILGTGAAVCHYDGTKITRIAPSAGWMLGDEGSGTCLGKTLLSEYLKGHLPSSFKKTLETECQLNETIVLRKIYQEPAPNRYMASFSYFIEEHLEEDFLQQLCHEVFSAFFKSMAFCFTDYRKYACNIVGSIGFCFQNVIRKCAEEQGIAIGEIEKSPIRGLIQYHKKR